MSLRTADGSQFEVSREQIEEAADHEDPIVRLAMEKLLEHRQSE